ncbi:nitrite reductase large subunit NirB [Neobacillus sp. 179-C4.2 HS]|uniref:Nitrite reductase large subunit NirB n=1 Tax=Neobacillus driksii TaxID=3035913 RepID=A0ABV4YVP2_9BACI|nr:nitrite reductase large subunit NirB [Neobacillus sp. 179.-C4.2 HS]MDP5192835.1 nitrite reductase large subunit NirB [Neobacillus sp. 179.-C4.2 HS]
MGKKKLVLVGNGMAGVRCIEEILKLDPTGFEITIFGSEPHVNYNRILLSSILQGSTSFGDITLHDREWYEHHQINLFTGETVIEIDKHLQVVETDQHRIVSYDYLIIATGSVPFSLPIPGTDKQGVVTFRTMEDCQKMIEISKKNKEAVVIGGGVLGLEAAKGLLNLGMDVNVVHIGSYLMERQLDETAARMLQVELESQGMKFLLQKETKEIVGDIGAKGVIFKDGTKVEANLIVMAAGVRPNVQLAQNSGIETNRAILVNDYMETSEPNIYAVGECVEHRGMVYGLVQPLYEQGKVLAKRICGTEGQGYEGSVLSTQLKISGVDLFSVGAIHDKKSSIQSIKIYDEVQRVYKKVVFQDHKIIGAVLFGDTKERTKLLDMILKHQDVSDIFKVSLFAQAKDDDFSFASIPASKIICNCNSVTKGTIQEAIQREGLTTVEEIQKCTKASSSCGGCKPLVADLLSYIQNNEVEKISEEKSCLCSCTPLNDDEVVQEIESQGLTTIQEVMKVLGWKNSQGCSTCRPAINYYLGMINPEYESKQQALFINEKMNAVIQSNGTYTLIPQMYGGITNPEQLRKIAHVAEKYQIYNVAITSDQRIHLLGVKKEDLSDVWAELNMPLSSPQANGVQNIKTCIGEHICSCDKKSSIELAISLEKQLEFLTTPYRIKMGISSCLHNGAGSTTKDVGIIGVDRGWEIYIGGSSGRNVRSGELLCVAATTEEAMELIRGFVQYYRETANYLERTWQWVERVGLVHVREVLFDVELRQQLLEHLAEEIALRKNLAAKSVF